jgi:hypothetical protein
MKLGSAQEAMHRKISKPKTIYSSRMRRDMV